MDDLYALKVALFIELGAAAETKHDEELLALLNKDPAIQLAFNEAVTHFSPLLH